MSRLRHHIWLGLGVMYVLFSPYWIYRAVSTGELWFWIESGFFVALGFGWILMAYRTQAASDRDGSPDA